MRHGVTDPFVGLVALWNAVRRGEYFWCCDGDLMTRAGASVRTCTSDSFKGVRNPNYRCSEERLAIVNERMKEFRRKYPIR